MPRYLHAADQQRHLIRLQAIALAVLAALLALALLGWMRAPRELRVHLPPDLRSGAVLRPDQVPPPNVYTFAHYIWQQLNRWPLDGAQDYGQAIFRLQAYLTPACRQRLQQDLQRKADQGELSLRTRALQELAGHGYAESRVQPLGPGRWRVTLDVGIRETVRGIPVKDTAVRYPLQVVRFAADPAQNPFGLAIDCYAPQEAPQRLAAPAGPEAASGPWRSLIEELP